MERRALVIAFLTALLLTTWDAKAQLGGSGAPGSIPVWETETTLRNSNLVQLPNTTVSNDCTGSLAAVCLAARNDADNTGVKGQNDGTGIGVHGVALTSGVGVVGNSNSGVGVQGNSDSGGAVKGISNSGRGVEGLSESAGGVVGFSTSSVGVAGNSFSGRGVQGVSNTAGGVVGLSTSSVGIAGISESTDGLVAATGANRAATFQGDVVIDGALIALVKLFRMDHPLDPANKYLNQSVVESPDMVNIYTGNVTTDGNGDATVLLPDYFSALNRDFRYQLTVIGQFAQAIVAQEIARNRFGIKTDKPDVRVSWQVTGIRQDAYALANPIEVEQEKPAKERGSYLRPELFNQPEEKGRIWVDHPKLMQELKDLREKRVSGRRSF